jgi:acetyltransferase-like isoleucine patch superfamily enzyme
MDIYNFYNGFYNVLETTYLKINTIYWNFLIKIGLKIRGVIVGNNCVFFGYTKFKKANSAQIIIGNKNIFRSFSTSNLIGINRPCIISALDKNAVITIGNNNGFSGTVIGCFKEIYIGNNVKCGANTLITDSDWHLDDSRSGIPSAINIEDNVWLGVNVTVLKGVTIGKNTIIGAGSVVVKNIPPNCVAAGNPCKVIKLL